MNLLDRLFTFYIPAALRADEITLARAKSLVALTFAAVLAGPSFIGVYLYLGHPGAAWAVAATLWLVPGIWFSLRRLQSLRAAQVANLVTFNLLFGYLVWSTGGHASQSVAAWFVVVPVMAAFAGGPLFGLLGLGSVLAVLGGFEAARAWGVAFPANPIADTRLWGLLCNLGLLPFVGILAIGSQVAKEQGDRQRQAQMDTIESLMAEVGRQSAQVGQSVDAMVRSLNAQSQQARAVRGAAESNNALAQAVEQTSAALAAEAAHARATAQAGAEVVGQAIASTVALAEAIGRADVLVRGLQSRSQDISAIADKIKGLAFQTNILALNAAVEAARAGEQGRGFAVVASEVRSLAQRSATAAKEIKTLIDDSVAQVENGHRLAGQAGSTMTEVVGSVQRVSTIMGEITRAHQEQNASIDRVNQSIVQLEAVTQQNAAMVEKAADTAQAMHNEANHLGTAIRSFKLDAHGGPTSLDPAAPLALPG